MLRWLHGLALMMSTQADDNELVEILCDVMREVGCADCPYRDECECMDELPS